MKKILLLLLQIQVHILHFVKTQECNMGCWYHFIVQNPSHIATNSISFQELSASTSQEKINYLVLASTQVLKAHYNEAWGHLYRDEVIVHLP